MARLRGTEFFKTRDGTLLPVCHREAYEALQDVVAWLEFVNTEEYLRALGALEKDIFDDKVREEWKRRHR